MTDDNLPPRFEDQLALFSSHGVLVAPHGAGLMNAMFLQPRSAVIELFPYGLEHNTFSLLVPHCGLAYYPVHAYNGSALWSSDKVHACMTLYLQLSAGRGC